MSTHTLELTTDELEAVTELLDAHAFKNPNPHEAIADELNEVRYKIAIIREEPLYK